MENSKLVPAIQKAMEILFLLSGAGEHEMGVSEIAAHFSYSKGTTHTVLQTLMHYGVVDKSLRTGKYMLGDRIMQIAEAYQRIQEDTSAFFEVARMLRVECKENINYSILKGMQNYVLAAVPAEDYSLRVDLPVGSMVPVLASSAGKVLVSDIDDNTLAHIFEQQYNQFTQNTVSSANEFIEQVRDAQQKGYAINKGEYETGICSVAAPVKNNHGKVVAAINIVMPQSRYNDHIEKHLIGLVKKGSSQITELMEKGQANTKVVGKLTLDGMSSRSELASTEVGSFIE